MRMHLLDSQFQVIVHRCQEIKAGTCKHLILSSQEERENKNTHTYHGVLFLYCLIVQDPKPGNGITYRDLGLPTEI